MNINQEELKIWIQALRSNEYKQSFGCLQSSNGYCCLGVACKVLTPEDQQQKRTNSNELYGVMPTDQEFAPEWLKTFNFYFKQKFDKSLATMNDSGEYSFNDIADLIEKEFVI